MRPLKTRISITLDSDILEMIKELAEDDDRSVSQYINIVLKDWITKETGEKSLNSKTERLLGALLNLVLCRN